MTAAKYPALPRSASKAGGTRLGKRLIAAAKALGAEIARGEIEPAGITTIAVAKRGRPLNSERDKTLTAQKPWVAAGMSRATWYKRQAEKKTSK
jgi:hypothetical protein